MGRGLRSPCSSIAMIISAHRGSSGSSPENTLAAFRLAVRAGADMIELDVRLTADRHLVVFHDRRLGRTAQGSGLIWTKTLAELRSLDAGSWFSPRFHGEKIPTLHDVFRSVPRKVGLNIEVKTDGDPRKKADLEEVLLAAIRTEAGERTILVSSFNHGLLRKLHQRAPQLNLGALYMPVRDVAKTPSALARRLGISAFICSRSQLRRRFVRNAHQHGLAVIVYGVNSPRHLVRARRYGVDAIITDFPEKMVRSDSEPTTNS
jgi:glycerophosphoryl diester phosphodiesterase